MGKKRSFIIGSGLVMLAISVSACRPQPAGGAGGGVPRDRLVAVEVLTPAKVTLQRSTTQPATVHAWFEARVFAKVSGYLSQLHADIGSPVKAGEVLAVIDVPEMVKQREAKQAAVKQLEAEGRRAEAQLAVATAGVAAYGARRDKVRAEVGKAEASLTAARLEMERVSELVRQKAVADRLLDEATMKHEAAQAEKTAAEAAVASAEAELVLSRAQAQTAQADLEVAQAMTEVTLRELEEIDERLKYTQLTSPFDGVVTQRHVDLGDLVRDTQTGPSKNGPPLFVITQLDKVRIRVPVPERDAPLAGSGDMARITLQALPGEALEGRVSRVARAMNEQTRTMLVEIDLPNPDGRLLPGMFGQATITLEPPHEAVTLPANVVRFDEKGKSYVYIVNASGEVEVVDVQTGLDDGQQIEITAGLGGSERVVGPSLKRFHSGQKVDIQ